VTILVHRAELVQQTSDKLTDCGVPHGIIAAGKTVRRSELIQVASVQTLARRLGKYEEPDLLIVDEAHHAAAGQWRKIMEACPGAVILGVTATPERLDGKGLGTVFDDLIRGPEVTDLIEQGFLSRPIYYSKPCVEISAKRRSMGDFNAQDVDNALNEGIMGDAVTEYRRHADGLPAIAFCPNLKKARAVSDAFIAGGYRWDVVDGTLAPATRRELVAKLGSGELHGLSACEIVSEGFDLPCVTAAILLRQTLSQGLHLQQIGRVLRPAPGKQNAIILDHAGNLLRHGLAEDHREWSLEGRVKKPGGAPLKSCPDCYCVVPTGSLDCPECGHVFVQKPEAAVKECKGDLVRLNAEDIKKSRETLSRDIANAKTLADFQAIAKANGFKRGWAWHKMQAKTARKPQITYGF
jgi:superfamily II DNA or RNA helicase